MTLQEKIDKLPLNIEYNGKLYGINFIIYQKCVKLQYWFLPSDPYDNTEKLFGCENENTLERDHIVNVLKQSTKLLYEKDN